MLPCSTRLFLFLLPCAHGWTSLSQARYGAQVAAGSNSIQSLQNGSYAPVGAEPYYSTLGFLWHLPKETGDPRGLGGGIAWAWDGDSLCGSNGISQRFHEDLFFASLVGCHDMQAAMHRAFNTWSDNHPSISFVDVTEECKARHGGVLTQHCELVEIWVTTSL